MGKLSDYDDYVQSCPRTKPVVKWWQLSKNHKVKIDLQYQKRLFGTAIKKAGNYTELAKRIGVPRKAISACFNLRRGPTIAYLIRVMQYADQNLDNLNDKFIDLAALKKPYLPFKLNTAEGAEIVAAFLSDGHLPKTEYQNPMYCAYEEELHLRLISVCKEVFGDFEIQIRKGHNTPLTRFPCPIGSALVMAGVPRGDKRRKNPFLPRFILKGDEKIQTSYLRRAFDDEGDVYVSESKRAVRITRSNDCGNAYWKKGMKKEKWVYGVRDTPPNNLLLGECLLLKKLGIDARLYPEGIYRSKNDRTTVKWRIQIAQQDNLKLFAEKIGFSHSKKKSKLQTALKSYKKKKSPHGFMLNLVWTHVLRLSKIKKEITFRDVGKKLVSLGMTYDYAGAFLRRFLAAGKIVKVKRGAYIVKRHHSD